MYQMSDDDFGVEVEENEEVGALTAFDLLARALAGKVSGYALVYKNKEGTVSFRYGNPGDACTFYELLGMVTQLQNDLMMDARNHEENT